MKKDNEKEEVLGAVASNEMIKSIFNEFKKYTTFEDFLVSVKAMGGTQSKRIVYEFPIEQIEEYEKAFVNKHATGSLNDTFVFNDRAKRLKRDDYGKLKPIGKFMPITFWSYILDTIKFEK